MFSIVIPAYNEAAVIERCLRTMLDGARPDELEIIVVANGCKDDTAERARAFGGPVRVIETPVGSKIGALNLGDSAARHFPRMYIDADIQVTIDALRQVAALLGDDSPIVVAAPQAMFSYEGRPLLVRSFYKVWTSLPFFTENLIGAGFYAFSRKGRERFESFPDIIGDDAFARLIARPEERLALKHATFTISPPRNLRAVAKIQTRARAGNYELRAKFPELMENETTSAQRSLKIIASRLDLWMHAPVYLGVMGYAKLRAHLKLKRGQEKIWERDNTGRES
ncbi:MAG TPA: glycosyltransferase family 2 protein [Polyangiaceae bacterium]|jgi:glycosyltransferase involved in cell wall biosynthesis|nr:glycosyltransferase family 2 protein [Polyangiaceae bacterium]